MLFLLYELMRMLLCRCISESSFQLRYHLAWCNLSEEIVDIPLGRWADRWIIEYQIDVIETAPSI